MTETRKKKLVDVAIPPAAIDAVSAREKPVRQGYPATLHLWWARRAMSFV